MVISQPLCILGQGLNKVPKLNIIIRVLSRRQHISGCNLSPLLFSIYICELGKILNKTGLGIEISNVNIVAILFADDIAIIVKDSKSLKILMKLLRKYFGILRLEISEKKTKIMHSDSETIYFPGDESLPSLELESVCHFKYLGIHVDCSPRKFTRKFNENMRKKADRYFYSVLSLARSGPDRSAMAYTIWTSCALPSVLYGTEIMAADSQTLKYLEILNNKIGKFILQSSQSSSNAAAHIDAGLRPVWAIIAEKSLLYARSVMEKPCHHWARLALNYHLMEASDSPYSAYLDKWMGKCGTTIRSQGLIKEAVKRAAIESVLVLKKNTNITSFAMSTPKRNWFRPKPWINDTLISKTVSEFRVCNAGFGNRAPAADGNRYKLCPLCLKRGAKILNNEVHVIIDCPSLHAYRQTCGLGPRIAGYRKLIKNMSSVKLYSILLNDSNQEIINKMGSDLIYMKEAWFKLMNINQEFRFREY